MIRSNLCLFGFDCKTGNTNLNPYENTKIEQSSKKEVPEEFFHPEKRVANNLPAIIHFPPELHINLSQFLDSRSIMALRQSNSVFHRNIGTEIVINKIKVEYERHKKDVEQRFARAACLDEMKNPVGEDPIMLTKFNTPDDRKELEAIISEILGDEDITKWFREKYPIFNKSVQRHEDGCGRLPLKENWNRHLTNQTFSRQSHTWINSLTLDVIHSYHH